jgi:hypothetical protein
VASNASPRGVVPRRTWDTLAPPGSDPQEDLRARLVAYAHIGTLSELCLAWHQGRLVMERGVLVDVLADLFVRIDEIEGPTLRRKR